MDEALFTQLRAQVAAQHVLLLALIESHPNRAKLAERIDHFATNTRDLQLAYPIEDGEIDRAQDLISIYRALAAL